MQETKSIPITDLFLASFLTLQGIVCTPVKKNGRVIFCFPEDSRVNELTRKFYDGESVPAFDLAQAVRRLRKEMFL